MVDTLNNLGFCTSYAEVQKYEIAAATKWNFEIETGENENKAVQFVADNIDHNTGTIDGLNTFHGMGIIATVTPAVKNVRSVPRVCASSADLVEVGKVNIHFYSQKSNSFDRLEFQRLHGDLSETFDQTCNLEFLIKITRPLKMRCPSWSGFMQTVQTGVYFGQSLVLFLPMIDMKLEPK